MGSSVADRTQFTDALFQSPCPVSQAAREKAAPSQLHPHPLGVDEALNSDR